VLHFMLHAPSDLMWSYYTRDLYFGNIPCKEWSQLRLSWLGFCSFYVSFSWGISSSHIEDGWRRFAFLHYNCARRM